jgi:hypothetical protein
LLRPFKMILIYFFFASVTAMCTGYFNIKNFRISPTHVSCEDQQVSGGRSYSLVVVRGANKFSPQKCNMLRISYIKLKINFLDNVFNLLFNAQI